MFQELTSLKLVWVSLSRKIHVSKILEKHYSPEKKRFSLLQKIVSIILFLSCFHYLFAIVEIQRSRTLQVSVSITPYFPCVVKEDCKCFKLPLLTFYKPSNLFQRFCLMLWTTLIKLTTLGLLVFIQDGEITLSQSCKQSFKQWHFLCVIQDKNLTSQAHTHKLSLASATVHRSCLNLSQLWNGIYGSMLWYSHTIKTVFAFVWYNYFVWTFTAPCCQRPVPKPIKSPRNAWRTLNSIWITPYMFDLQF